MLSDNNQNINDAQLDELQEMREQLKLLQQRLDERVDFDEKMIRKAMQRNASNLLLWEWGVLALCAFALVFVMIEVHNCGLSKEMQIFTGVFLFSMVLVQCWSVWFVTQKRKDVIDGNLMRVGERIVTYKKADRWCKMISIPVACIWAFCYMHSVLNVTNPNASVSYQMGFYFGGFMGAAFGALLGFLAYRKMMSLVNELQQQINELKSAA